MAMMADSFVSVIREADLHFSAATLLCGKQIRVQKQAAYLGGFGGGPGKREYRLGSGSQ